MDGAYFRLATRLRRVQRKLVQFGRRNSIHPDATGTSQEDELRGGIHRVVEKTWCGIRPEICIRMNLSRAYGARLLLHHLPTAFHPAARSARRGPRMPWANLWSRLAALETILPHR